MQQKESDIIILKPTQAFLSFLDMQLPDLYLPDIRTLRSNRTAYTLEKQDDDERTLDEIERHYPEMFQHEISRVLGLEASQDVSGSFLDFLCCFKFEWHSQIILMEPTLQQGHQLLCIKPRTVLLKWVESSVAEEAPDTMQVLERVNLSHLTEDTTVLVKNFNHPSEIKPFVKQYYRPIFKAEMLRMSAHQEQWPSVNSFQMFRRYFKMEIHTQLVHLS